MTTYTVEVDFGPEGPESDDTGNVALALRAAVERMGYNAKVRCDDDEVMAPPQP